MRAVPESAMMSLSVPNSNIFYHSACSAFICVLPEDPVADLSLRAQEIYFVNDSRKHNQGDDKREDSK